MPWKECSVMDERLQFVARRLAGEQMADLCREFGISRKTGYKIFVDPVPIRGNLIREWPRAPRQKLSKITLGVPAKHGDVGTTAELVRVAIIQLCEGCGPKLR